MWATGSIEPFVLQDLPKGIYREAIRRRRCAHGMENARLMNGPTDRDSPNLPTSSETHGNRSEAGSVDDPAQTIPENGNPMSTQTEAGIITGASGTVTPIYGHPHPSVRDIPALEGLSGKAYVRTLFEFISARLDDEQAEDVTVIDLTGKSEIADRMVIASGRSARHVGAIADKLLRSLKEAGVPGVKVEGQPACDWVLIDSGDIIVHLFRPEVRAFYNLERIWSETARAPVRQPLEQ